LQGEDVGKVTARRAADGTPRVPAMWCFLNRRGLGAAIGRNQNDPTDFKSVVRVILHYIEKRAMNAPAEFISVERMILHYGECIVAQSLPPPR
jgi:hypothetical protein